MPELVPTLITVAVILLAFVGMALGWRSRRRGQSQLDVPAAVPAGIGPATYERDLLYVSTTFRDRPLERVAVAGLGIRSRAVLSLHAEGVVLALRGGEPVFLAADRIDGVGRATMTIDRVVERDGLVRIAWTLGGTDVDTYLRAGTREDTAELVAALEAHPRRWGPLEPKTQQLEGDDSRGNS
ncbi:MAG: hypothetical protein ABWZ77_03265 [Naasia sp.]